jgi:hypothetical protein
MNGNQTVLIVVVGIAGLMLAVVCAGRASACPSWRSRRAGTFSASALA